MIKHLIMEVDLIKYIRHFSKKQKKLCTVMNIFPSC